MSLQVENMEKNMAKLTITVPAEEVAVTETTGATEAETIPTEETVPQQTETVPEIIPSQEDIPVETIPSLEDLAQMPVWEGYAEVPLYFQTDYPNNLYGGGTIANNGCGITCLAMVANYLTGHHYLPDELAKYFGGVAENNIERLENLSADDRQNKT